MAQITLMGIDSHKDPLDAADELCDLIAFNPY